MKIASTAKIPDSSTDTLLLAELRRIFFINKLVFKKCGGHNFS